MADRTEIDVALEVLDPLAERHTGLAEEMFRAMDGKFFGFDLLAAAALNRSHAHIAGFRALILARNILCAGAILRLELDTALRFYGAWLVKDPHEYAMYVLEGKHVRNLKDLAGEFMTDRYLAERLGEHFDWVPALYRYTSGYVHFSELHMHAAMFAPEGVSKEGEIHFAIGPQDRDLPPSLYVGAVEGFVQSAEVLLEFVKGWTYTKMYPDVAKRMRAAREIADDA